jgi:hypothetical protein
VAQAQQNIAACRLREDLPGLGGLPPSKVVRRLEEVGVLPILANCLASQDPDTCSILLKYLRVWRHIHPTINGYDLQSRGLAPGPAYKYILGNLKDAWLDGKVTNTEEESKLFGQLLLDSSTDKIQAESE